VRARLAAHFNVLRRGDAKPEAVQGIRRIGDAARPEPKKTPKWEELPIAHGAAIN
jgi:hypothetical protein